MDVLGSSFRLFVVLFGSFLNSSDRPGCRGFFRELFFSGLFCFGCGVVQSVLFLFGVFRSGCFRSGVCPSGCFSSRVFRLCLLFCFGLCFFRRGFVR